MAGDTDVNDVARDEWKAETTTFQRVRSVIKTTYDGATAGEIAERALVSETTARTHLEDLAETGFVETVSDADRGATRYRRSTESLVLEQAQDMLENADAATLLTKVAEMQNEIDSYREETGVDEPEDISWDEADIDAERVRQWQTTRRNLGFAKVALALDQAADAVQGPNAV